MIGNAKTLSPRMFLRESTAPTAQPDVQQLSGSIGAIVGNIDVRTADAAVVADLNGLIAEHKVIFLRGQDVTEHEFTRFAEQFGTLAVHPLRTLIDRPLTVSVIEDSPSRPPAGFPWHTDLSWLPAPPRIGFLHALDIPERGGDTLWASLTAAYRSLSPAIQSFIEQLDSIHAIDPSFRASVERNHGPHVAQQLDAAHQPTTHPLVRKHPETGEPSLWLSPLYVQSIVDLLPDESVMLLEHLNRVIEDPNIAVRWHWAPGDIAIWDESCTVHRALVDHHPLGRRMRRCTTEGDRVERYARTAVQY